MSRCKQGTARCCCTFTLSKKPPCLGIQPPPLPHQQQKQFPKIQYVSYISSIHVENYPSLDYQLTLKNPSEARDPASSTHHFLDFNGPHFFLVDRTSFAKLVIGGHPSLTGILIAYWPTEMMKIGNEGDSPRLPHWWEKAVMPIEDICVRITNVRMNQAIIETILTRSPKLTKLTIEADLFSEDLFPYAWEAGSHNTSLRAKRLIERVKQLKILTIINMSTYYFNRTLASNYCTRSLNCNVSRLQQWTSGRLEALSLRTSDDGQCIMKTSFVDDCILPFILNNLTTLKHLDLYNTPLEPKHIRKIIKHHNYKHLKLVSLIIDVYFERKMTMPDVSQMRAFQLDNGADILRVLKNQATMTDLYVRMDSWDKLGIRKILRSVPNLETMCFHHVEMALEEFASICPRTDLIDIFLEFSPKLKVIKFICELPTPLKGAMIKCAQVFRAAQASSEFFKNLPKKLESLTMTNMFITSSSCFEVLTKQCPNLTSLTLNCNEEVLCNEGFKKMIKALKLLRYLDISDSIVSDDGIFDDSWSSLDSVDAAAGQASCAGGNLVRSSVLNSLEFLQDLKLVYFPYLTSAGFSSIKCPKLRLIDLSRNCAVTEVMLENLVLANSVLHYIIVKFCPNLDIESILRTTSLGRRSGRDIAFETDILHNDQVVSSTVREFNSAGSDPPVVKENSSKSWSAQIRDSAKSIPTLTDVSDLEEDDCDDFEDLSLNYTCRMLKRMKVVEEDIVGESVIATFLNPGGTDEVIQALQTFHQNQEWAHMMESLIHKSLEFIPSLSKMNTPQSKTDVSSQADETEIDNCIAAASEYTSSSVPGKPEDSAACMRIIIPTPTNPAPILPFSAVEALLHVQKRYEWAPQIKVKKNRRATV